MTRDYAIIVPLMIANMISFAISSLLQPEPIYEALALQDGVHLPTSEARREFGGVRVGEIMDRDAQPMPPETDVEQAKAFLDEACTNSWPVGTGCYVDGVVNVQQLQNADHVLTVRDLIAGHDGYAHAHSDHEVTYVLDRMRNEGLNALPVVSRANIHELLGVVTLAGILASYGYAGKPYPVFNAGRDFE
jgi:CIC family chloride channel protein